ncbi:MAG: hypothetical protein MZV63_56015 [Marinilabiliales bacterium]|nr:hypothetical protein [Marinilabiliales bacterium]
MENASQPVLPSGTPTTDDNCPGETGFLATPRRRVPKGTTAVIWTVTDASGNTAICTQLR